MVRRRINPSINSRTSRAITRVLIKLGVVERGDCMMVKRCYPGRHQLAAGAWRVVFLHPDGRDFGGSCFTCRDILGSKKLSTYYDRHGDWHVFVEDYEVRD